MTKYSPPYHEFIPTVIRETVESWNLEPKLLRALWEAARDELRNRDAADLRKIVAPVRALIVPVSVEDPSSECEYVRNFAFYVDDWTREGERTVVYVVDLDRHPNIGRVTGSALSGSDPTMPVVPE